MLHVLQICNKIELNVVQLLFRRVTSISDDLHQIFNGIEIAKFKRGTSEIMVWGQCRASKEGAECDIPPQESLTMVVVRPEANRGNAVWVDTYMHVDRLEQDQNEGCAAQRAVGSPGFICLSGQAIAIP